MLTIFIGKTLILLIYHIAIYYANCSGVYGSGLCILSKYPIALTLFHAWSVNGYVHRIQHGDWFGGKGVGLCQIIVQNQPVNIYIAHVSSDTIICVAGLF